MLILRTLHGSRLYGLNRPGSDFDWYEVYDHARTRQRISGDQDVTRIGLSEWLAQCDRGVPQALEAMFAPPRFADVDVMGCYRAGYRANVGNAAATYTRTIAAFMHDGNPKKVLHTHRLRRDLNELRMFGRFDPTAFGRTRVWPLR
jgi:hypothetical protein